MALRWLARALGDLEAIERFIHIDNPAAARTVQRRIVEAAGLLADHPRLGRPGRVARTHELVVPGTPYLVAYTIAGEDVTVLAVLHGARTWPDAF
jgi:plasmid stabilization system protein ParE